VSWFLEFIDATREKEIAETLVDATRKPCHRAERLVFKWFRGIHLDPQEKWWEDTPWGKSSGEGEPPAPEWPDWPGPVAGFEVNLIALPLTTEIIFSRIFDYPKCVLEREQEGMGMWEYITEYNLEEEEILPFRDNVPYPGKLHYRATPFNAAGEVGIISEGTIEVV